MRARIMVDGKPFFGTDRSYPVLTGGSPDTADLMLRRAAATEPLENTYWKLMQLADAPVTVVPGQQEPHLIFNSQTGKVAGSGGCNRLTGAYQASAGRLSLDGMAGTMMACTEGMETERAFLKTLGEVSGWRIAGQQLELTDEGGAVVARFEARHME